MTLTEVAEWATIIGAGAAVLTSIGVPMVRSIRTIRQQQTVGDNSTAVQSGGDSNVEIEHDQTNSRSRRK